MTKNTNRAIVRKHGSKQLNAENIKFAHKMAKQVTRSHEHPTVSKECRRNLLFKFSTFARIMSNQQKTRCEKVTKKDMTKRYIQWFLEEEENDDECNEEHIQPVQPVQPFQPILNV